MKPTVRKLQREVAIITSMLGTAVNTKNSEAMCRLRLILAITKTELIKQQEKDLIKSKLETRYRRVS